MVQMALNAANSAGDDNFIGLSRKKHYRWKELLNEKRFGGIKLGKFLNKYFLHAQSSLIEATAVGLLSDEFKMSLNSFLLMDANNVLQVKGIGPKTYVAIVKRFNELNIATGKYSVCKLARKLAKKK